MTLNKYTEINKYFIINLLLTHLFICYQSIRSLDLEILASDICFYMLTKHAHAITDL